MATMKAVRVHEFGGPEKMIYEDAPMPEPGSGEARIKVEAVGLNFVDVYHRTGRYAGHLPHIPGSEAAGVVDAVGANVTDLKAGDRVVSARIDGAYAEYAVGTAWKLVPVPDSVSSELAAAVMLQGLTAHYLARSTFPLQDGQIALVHAAAGGVGLLLTQIAKKLGARVIGTTSTEEKAELARKAGADDVILYTETDFEAETKRLTGGKGVHVVYDGVGKTTFDKGLNVLRPRGYMVLYGASSGAVPPIDPQILNPKGSLFLTRPTLGSYMQDRDELMWRANELFGWMAAGELDVRIDKTFKLVDAPDSHRYLEGRESKGKIILVP